MPPDPGSPQDWMRFAQSDLAVCKGGRGPDVLLETLCFHAQQAVEKSFKAVLLKNGIEFPKTHNLRTLFDLLPDHIETGPEIEKTVALTDYAVSIRYPGDYETISEEEYEDATVSAEIVVKWAKGLLEQNNQ